MQDTGTLHFTRRSITVETDGQGVTEITDQVNAAIRRANYHMGTATVFVRHTSCSLVITENADPSARGDLQAFFRRLVPEGDSLYTHTVEGDDDMPAHVKAALLRTSETIPIENNRLALGTWQGLFLWEHRRRPHTRELVVSLAGVRDEEG